ncbi:glycosyltransferase family 4 protein [Solirubrobacter sp. CPCC 204708]|uniref:Glycosyltransferase family 4 protein n=1 Tax=Solirubrobacter deserti TaxID=2282478 RepID=A0ABT4RIK5_9ACTN|nr:glycosyltransferase family 4 protein [Solirubrobacter deserti]MBE2320238.1 glycosyltransferase family 4 protein [Solirubrobacter deserti]MDA0138376.1 glycosyltransferase family 4 protein [Solirubrobacter deserti]
MTQASATAGRGVRVLHSFPHRLGAGRICDTAFYEVAGAANAGADVTVMPASLARTVPDGVTVRPTLARGSVRVPYRVIGELRALRAHDHIVARRLARSRQRPDVVHVWPLGALRTLEVAKRLGIPTVLERPNTHTRYAYETVRAECERLGVPLPADHEHAFNETVLRIEEAEYDLADHLLCPSDFVAGTFERAGYSPDRLVRHLYGYDPAVFTPGEPPAPGQPLRMLYVGVAAVRKGLHFALEAWLRSPASSSGTFTVAGDLLPAYGEKLKDQLAHPSVQVLGHRSDIPELMRLHDVLVLPSIEEGSALVCNEAIGSGCVPLVSDAASGVCHHEVNALVHPVRDVDALAAHITAVNADRGLLRALREQGLAHAADITWSAAGRRLADIYSEVALVPAR